MPEPKPNPILGGKLTPRYLATLVAVATGILVIGAALRPRKPASDAAPPPSQTEVRRLQGLAERRSLETMTHHFASIAADVASRIVQVWPAAGTGIVWSVDLVVAAGQTEPAAESTRLVTASGEPLAASRVVGGPGLPLAAYQIAGRLDPAARRDNGADLASGQWLVAVWRGDAGHVFAPGHYVETRPVRCGHLPAREVATSLELSESMAGAGLFDLDEALVAVVLPCDGRYAALSPESVALGLVQGRSIEGRLRAHYGLGVLRLDEALRKHLGAESGVLVSEVFTGFAADLGGLRPGDVIVGFDETAVASPEDLQPLLARTEHAGADLDVWRARRKRQIRLLGRAFEAPAPRDNGGPGLELAPPAEGYRIGPVVPDSPAAKAGIREGDRLLRIDFVAPRTAAAAGRALSGHSDGPVLLEIQSGARRFGSLVGPR